MFWLKAIFGFENYNYHQFNMWCRSGNFVSGNTGFVTSHRFSGNAPTVDQFNGLVDEFNRALRERKIHNATFDSQYPTGVYQFVGSKDPDENILNTLTLGHQVPNCQILFRNIRMKHGNIYWQGHPDITDPVIFENCEFVQLQLQQDSRVYLKNCKVGTLAIAKAHQIHMEGGCVLNIQVSAPGAENPLTGSVNFSNTFFPRNRFEYLLPGAQPYRNMRHHLRSIENGHMANLFHSAELAVERADDSLLNKFLSYAYEWLSDFGSSALRPLLWWVFLYVGAVAVILYSGGAAQAFESDITYQGWRATLIDHQLWYSDLLRANYLSLRSMINPLGLFGIKELIIPDYGWLVVFLSFTGLMSVMLITLFILSVRRRFKMQV